MTAQGPTPMLLLADPDADMAGDVIDRARRRGIRAEWCCNGGEALVLAGATQPDVIVVAAALPTVGSSEVIQTIKDRWRATILVGVGVGQEALGRSALIAGAAAAITRPYDLDAILTLGLGVTSWPSELDSAETMLVAGPITVDSQRHEARIDGRALPFTHRELQLLTYLIKRGGRVASQAEISAAVWGHRVDTNTVAVHIKRLRDKLGDHPQYGKLILTIRGAGYRLAPTLCEPAQPTAS